MCNANRWRSLLKNVWFAWWALHSPNLRLPDEVLRNGPPPRKKLEFWNFDRKMVFFAYKSMT